MPKMINGFPAYLNMPAPRSEAATRPFELSADARAKAKDMLNVLTNPHHSQKEVIGVLLTFDPSRAVSLDRYKSDLGDRGMTVVQNRSGKTDILLGVEATRPQIRDLLDDPRLVKAELLPGWLPGPKKVNLNSLDYFER